MSTMSGNTYGKLFTVTSFGESHGPAIGCIVDGCPPGLALSEQDKEENIHRQPPCLVESSPEKSNCSYESLHEIPHNRPNLPNPPP